MLIGKIIEIFPEIKEGIILEEEKRPGDPVREHHFYFSQIEGWRDGMTSLGDVDLRMNFPLKFTCIRPHGGEEVVDRVFPIRFSESHGA